MDLQAEIEDHGKVAVVADSLEKTREAMSLHTFSWAILDLNLGKTSTMPVAEELAAAGTKICFVTGSDIPDDALNELDAKLLIKPIDLQHLVDLIK